MPISICEHCCSEIEWSWTEAFEKFGFDDGDGLVETETVAEVLRDAGYETVTEGWGLHNTVIVSIRRRGRELMPLDDIRLGYDDPRDYLPPEIVALLDLAFP